MSDQDKIEAIRRIKKTHENFVVGGGIAIGVILSVYFFTLSESIDKAPAFAYFQVITAVALVFALVYIRGVAFFFTKLLLGRKPVYHALVVAIDVADLAKDEQALLDIATKNPRPS